MGNHERLARRARSQADDLFVFAVLDDADEERHVCLLQRRRQDVALLELDTVVEASLARRVARDVEHARRDVDPVHVGAV